jgi:hypothetical protein
MRGGGGPECFAVRDPFGSVVEVKFGFLALA